MQNQKIIEQLGYSPNEARVYLASLRLGEAHISDIAAEVKMPRSTVQVIAERLHKDGLMNFYIMRRFKYWAAERPEMLLKMVEDRRAVLQAALPQLSAVRQARKKYNRNGDAFYGESLGLLKTCSETFHHPALITNSDVEIVYVNTAWQKEFGYTLEEIQGENPRILKSGQVPKKVYEDMWEALKFDNLFQSDQLIDKRKDGTLLNLLTTIFPVYHGNRKFYIQILNTIADKHEAKTVRQTFLNLENGA